MLNKTHQFFFLTPVPLRPPPPNTQYPLIGQLTHAWASVAYKQQSSGAKLILMWKTSCQAYI